MNFPNEMFLFLDSKFELKKFFRFAEEKQKAQATRREIFEGVKAPAYWWSSLINLE